MRGINPAVRWMMKEETLWDDRYLATRSPADEALMQKYCHNIEEKIRLARSSRAARRIAGDACREFERECYSEVIPIFLKRYVNELLEKYWGVSL